MDFVFYSERNFFRSAKKFFCSRQINERFINRHLNYVWRIVFENAHDFAGFFSIALHSRTKKNRIRAKPFCSCAWHCRMNTKCPRLVRGCGHNASLFFWKPADNYGAISVLRIIQLFDRGKKGVHVNVKKNSAHTVSPFCALVFSFVESFRVSFVIVLSPVFSHAVIVITALSLLSEE